MIEPTRAARFPLLLAGLWVCSIPAAAVAQEPTPLEQQYQAKLAERWVQASPWVVGDLDEAKRQAAERGVPIFAYFTRSYAP